MPKGDFTDRPPHPTQLEKPKEPGRSSFDPDRSQVLEAETTETKKVYRNPDGTTTEAISLLPTRYRAPEGWRDIDLGLVPGPGGSLQARSAERSARLPATADGLASVDTPAGPIGLRHRDAAPVAAVVDGERATYPGALGRRDLQMVLTVEGFEELVIVPDAAAGGSWVDEFALPAGVTARQGERGVEFVGGDGEVIARFDDGWAFDATTAPRPPAPVSVRLLAETPGSPTSTTTPSPEGGPGSPASQTVAVEVSVDPAWLGDPARVFPVTIDPSTTIVSASHTQGEDAFVYNGVYANTNYGTYGELWEGTNGPDAARSYLRFSGLPAPSEDKWVTKSWISLENHASHLCPSSPRPIEVRAPAASWSEATITWNNQPAFDPSGGTTTPNPPLGSTLTNCGAGQVEIDTTWLAWRWLKGTLANHGVVLKDLTENEASGGWRFFRSAESSVGPVPYLWVTYGTGSRAPAPTADAGALADGAVIATTTPKLSVVNDKRDADNEVIRYWFRATPVSDAESGAKVVDSGWITPGDPDFRDCPADGDVCTYRVAPGVLHDGVTYWWHAWSYDGTTEWTMAPWVRSFAVALHLGAADPFPRDQMGPVQVNLASGNAVVGVSSPTFPTVGGPVGIAYAYNSATPSPKVGLKGSYYPDSNGNRIIDEPAAMVRTDPSVVFWWGGQPPAPALGATNFLVRWEGWISVPRDGTYRFGAAADDGVRIWIDDQLVVDRWSLQYAWPTAHYSGPITMSGGEANKKPIAVEYFQADQDSFMELVAKGPLGPDGAEKEVGVPADWLSTEPTLLPRGWTMAPSGLRYATARVSDRAAVLTDSTGAAHTYRWTGSGFEPPPGEDATLALDASGALTLHADDGVTYVFDASGNLTAATTALDEPNRSSPVYEWSSFPNRPPRLVKITDPVGNRHIRIRYQGLDPNDPPDPANVCEAPPEGLGFSTPPTTCPARWTTGTAPPPTCGT